VGALGEETDTMIGYHAVSVIADAMAKGIKGFDYEKAYAAAKTPPNSITSASPLQKRGYISMEDENESVSKTLEYAYDDWCIAQMAKMMAARYEKFLTTVNKVYYPDLGSEYGRDYQNTRHAHEISKISSIRRPVSSARRRMVVLSSLLLLTK
jgi:hypothetical protein